MKIKNLVICGFIGYIHYNENRKYPVFGVEDWKIKTPIHRSLFPFNYLLPKNYLVSFDYVTKNNREYPVY